MIQMWKELMDYRELLVAFTWRNIKIKYKQTFMGILWAVFMPMIIACSGILARIGLSIYSGKEVEITHIATVMVKALPWAFFIGALKFAVGSLVSNMGILQKIYFPRVIFPLSYILGSLFDFIIASVVFTLILVYIKIGISIHLAYLPLLILILFLFTSGVGMILACGNLFYRDVKYIVDVVLTFAIFFTPVIYDASMFKQAETLLLLNPMGSILECINSVVVLHQAPPWRWLSYSGLWAIVAFVGGCFIFHKAEPVFAERI